MMKTGTTHGLTILGIMLLAVFAAIGLIIFSHILQTTDVALFYSINAGYPLPFVDQSMVLLSIYGRELFWIVLAILLWVFDGKEGKRTVFMIAILFVLLTIVGYLLKTLEFRPRPYSTLSGVRLLVSPEGDSSFPSGHALIVSGGAVLLLMRMKMKWVLPVAVESSLVAYSRIYVGVHYPLDVLAGSILGIAFACIVVGQTTRLTNVYNKLATSLKEQFRNPHT